MYMVNISGAAGNVAPIAGSTGTFDTPLASTAGTRLRGVSYDISTASVGSTQDKLQMAFAQAALKKQERTAPGSKPVLVKLFNAATSGAKFDMTLPPDASTKADKKLGAKWLKGKTRKRALAKRSLEDEEELPRAVVDPTVDVTAYLGSARPLVLINSKGPASKLALEFQTKKTTITGSVRVGDDIVTTKHSVITDREPDVLVQNHGSMLFSPPENTVGSVKLIWAQGKAIEYHLPNTFWFNPKTEFASILETTSASGSEETKIPTPQNVGQLQEVYATMAEKFMKTGDPSPYGGKYTLEDGSRMCGAIVNQMTENPNPINGLAEWMKETCDAQGKKYAIEESLRAEQQLASYVDLQGTFDGEGLNAGREVTNVDTYQPKTIFLMPADHLYNAARVLAEKGRALRRYLRGKL